MYFEKVVGDIMKTLWNNLKFAWQYAKDQKWMMIQYIISSIITIIISLVIPILSAKIIILFTNNKFYQLIFMAFIIFLIENIRNIVSYFTNYCSHYIYRETFTKIQTDLGKSILKLENKIIDNNSSGVFIQRLTNDTDRLADIFNVLNVYLTRIIIDIGIFCAIFIIHKMVFFYLIIMIILLYLLENKRVKKYVEKDKVFREKKEKVSGFVGEIIRGIRDIKMLNAENSFVDELHSKVKDLNKIRYDMLDSNRKYRLGSSFMMDLNDLVLIVLLVYLIENSSLEIASALIIHNYSFRITSIINYVGELLDKVKDFNLSATRIFAILDSDEYKKEQFGNKHLNQVHGDFSFENVEFSYGKEKILKDVSFQIHANETVAFVGKSGAGKSTIFSLLCKMYNIDAGKIMIDGIDIRELDRESIRSNITIISQNPYIFNVSIRDNFRLVKPSLTDAEMIHACKVACLDTFVESLPEKYDTIIGEGGVNLSGGQKQRLAIARALVQKTEIILFDEATSALDNETQSSIQKAIENMKHEYTILIIAHRLSTIINSDRILFLDDGKIESEGTHCELLTKSNKYRSLYESELKK